VIYSRVRSGSQYQKGTEGLACHSPVFWLDKPRSPRT
jgi:hypothetical protein